MIDFLVENGGNIMGAVAVAIADPIPDRNTALATATAPMMFPPFSTKKSTIVSSCDYIYKFTIFYHLSKFLAATFIELVKHFYINKS